MFILSISASILFIIFIFIIWFIYNCDKEYKYKSTKSDIKLQKQYEQLVKHMKDYFN